MLTKTESRQLVIERKRALVERGAGDVRMEPGNRDDEQVAVRHAAASGGDIRENRHEEDRLRDIDVAKGDQRQHVKNNRKLGTVRFEKDVMEIRQGRHKIGRGPYLCRSQVMLMTTDEFLRWIHCTSRYIGEVLEWYRGEDAGDLKRSELNELVETLICLNALDGEIWKSNQNVVTDEKSWKTWKSNQKIVMNEELVQNGVMNEKFVKNFVMNAKIDPKVVMDLSVFKFGGWNSQFAIQQSKFVGRMY